MTTKPQSSRAPKALTARITIAALAVAATTLQLRVAWHAYSNQSPASGAKVELAVQERRFAGLRAHIRNMKIPTGVIVGYDAGTTAWGLWPWEREYFRAQYMLAPTPLQYQTGPWLVVLNFPCDADLRAAVASGRYSLIWPAKPDLPPEGERGDDRGVALAWRLAP